MKLVFILVSAVFLSCQTAKEPDLTTEVIHPQELSGTWTKLHIACVPADKIGDSQYEPAKQLSEKDKQHGFILIEEPPTRITMSFADGAGQLEKKEFRGYKKEACTIIRPYSFSLSEGEILLTFKDTQKSGAQCSEGDEPAQIKYSLAYNETSHTLYMVDKSSEKCKEPTKSESQLQFVTVMAKVK